MSSLYVNKYAPKTIDDMFLVPRMEENLRAFLNDDMNLLLYGSAGVGKTTFCNVITEHRQAKVLEIDLTNVEERGVAVFERITKFYQANVGRNKSPLYVVLHEVDNLSSKAMDIIKNMG